MSITAARLQAEVGADTKDFDKGMAHADRTVAAAPSKWGKALKVGAGVGLGIGAGVIVRGVVGGLNAGLESLRETGVVVAQTEAVIKSTGGSANVTAGDIRNLSNSVEDLTAIDDKAVQAGANMLLTFTNIRNEAGKGNDIFDQSVGILADMSTAMGTDMKSGAIQLGKALNDPLKGITALTRVGVTFSDQQKEQIENFVKAGKVAEAQKVILAELNKEFGGSGAAFAATDAGQAAKFEDAIEGIQQAAAKGLLPTITRVRQQLTGFLSDPATIGQAEALGEAIAGIFTEGNLRTAANVMTTAAGAISTAIRLFGSLPKEVQALAVGAIALKKITGIGPLDIAKGAGGVLKLAFQRGETPANPLYVSAVGLSGGGAGGVPAGVTGKGSKIGAVASAVGKVFIVGAAAGAFIELAGVLGQQSAENKQSAANLDKQTQAFTGGATLADLERSLKGVDEQIYELTYGSKALTPEGIAYALNMDGVRTQVEKTRADLAAAIDRERAELAANSVITNERLEAIRGFTQADAERAQANVIATERAEAIASQKADQVKAQIAAGDTRTELAMSRNAAAAASTGSGIVSAARNAGIAVAGSVDRKKWQFTNNLRVDVTTKSYLSMKETSKTQTTSKKLGNVYVS